MDTPNDMELGGKIRRMLYESKGIPLPKDPKWEKISPR
jgi:hypothetical protein